ncbi:IclR family transcriptional regulator [Novosphingobium piscinae]|uniref:Helix-turn-helix domain-containing protein n=1 Tax=Novosphingobium piscinae TaxID=1507448 RepID=A0A7X1FVH6_9SPHN|nr:IclR family transcriptional regulator C-terminal domain-containing protein [Novosphingobium piscinae]MBC2667744.1 helix-turn-helix domain-containing protein [Novosphingobium piscinae]
MTSDSAAPSKAPAIARAAAILRLLGRSEAPLGVNAIARELDLVPSTCLYLLRALAEEELVGFDPATKRYTLAAGVLTLARGWLKRDRFADLAQPLLDRVATEHGLTMLGVQVVGLQHMIVVAKALGTGNFQLNAEVGSRFPALISATGRCVAAFGGHDPEVLRRRFSGLRWEAPPTFDHWRDEVARTRQTGYAVDEGNYIAGVTVVAAPVFRSPGQLSHALAAVGLGSAVRRGGLEQLAGAVAGAARSLSERLSGA